MQFTFHKVAVVTVLRKEPVGRQVQEGRQSLPSDPETLKIRIVNFW